MLESVVAGLLNRFLKTYVDNLNTSQLNIGIWSGDVRLKNLKLKKEALDKFRLPVDVKEGYLGDLTLSIPWSNLKGKPVKVLVENVYLLAAPINPDAQYDPEEEEKRAYAAKMEKLESAELLTTKPSAGLSAEDEAKNESFMTSLTNRIIDNVQLTVKNVHMRYEDDVSVPGHPFAIGVTLAGFTAVSTDKFWQPTFIHNAGEGIHKIAKLDSLAAYFDSECKSLAGYPAEEAIQKFNALIAKAGEDAEKVTHQYILAPVSGEGRLVMNHHISADTPKTDAELLFKNLAFTIDEEQYKDALSLIDLVHFYTRKNQYRKYRPSQQLIENNRYRALWRFAQDSILHEVKEKHRRWTWDYFRERRDDRRLYVYLFKLKGRAEVLTPDDKAKLEELERKLSYQDIRFYRSIARSELRKEKVSARQTEEQKKLQQGPTGKGTSGQASGGGWLGWIWGGNKTQAHADNEQPQDLLSDEQRKELYDAIDWDEKEAVTSGIDMPKDALKLRLKAKLDTGSFALRRDPHGRNSDMLKITFDRFSADVLQRPDNLEAEMSLGAMGVFDGTLENTLHKQIVRVKQADDTRESGGYLVDPESRGSESAQIAHASSDHLDKKAKDSDPTASVDHDPFFYVKFENNPLDERADTGLTVRMRYMEIIYHKGYVEDIVRFFKPPASQLESVNALVDAASTTLEGIRKETRAGLEFALQQHKTVDLRVDMNAPIIIIPEDVTRADCQHIVLDAGYISVNSELVDKAAVADIRAKENQQYSDADFEKLESLVYDRYHIKLQSAQLLMANTLEDCMDALQEDSSPQIHILERINIDFKAETCIVAKAPNLTRFRILGDLPDLHIHFSDRKYKRLMRMIDVAIPKFSEDTDELSNQEQFPSKADKSSEAKSTKTVATYRQAPLYPDHDDALSLGDHTDTEGEDDAEAVSPSKKPPSIKERDDGEDTFYDPGEIVEGNSNFRQKSFEFKFTVSKLQASIYKSDTSQDKPDKLLADAILQSFDFEFALRPYDMQVDIKLGAFTIDDKMVEETSRFQQLVTSDPDHAGKHGTSDLVRIHYARVQPDSPEFMTVHEGNNQSVDVELSTISLVVTRASILMLFDWIMTTFTSGPDAEPPRAGEVTDQSAVAIAPAVPEDTTERLEKLRVKVKLSEVRLIFNDDGTRLATLSLQAADVSVLLRGPFMRVAAQLGNLSVRDDFESDNIQEYRQLLSIEGDNLADFSYEKYDISDPTYPGYDSQVFLRTGSFRLTFVEAPVHRILRFLTKFARMKAVYDAATSAAAQQASDLQQQVTKMRYDILAKTPIIVLPRHGQSTDAIVANLGEMSLSNSFSDANGHSVTHIEAGLRKIRLSSRSDNNDSNDELQMLKDADLAFDITMADNGNLDRHGSGNDRPDTEVIGTLSDIKMNVTAHQYAFLMDLSKTIPRAFATSEEEASEDEDLAQRATPSQSPEQSAAPTPGQTIDPEQKPSETVDLFPELAMVAVDEQGHKTTLYSKLEFAFRCGGVQLELFTPEAVTKASLKANSLARFALNDVDVKYKMVSNGSSEAEVLLKSFTVHDTRPEKATKFREILPASKEKGYQLMVSYTVSGGSDRSSVANVTVDTPSIIFSLDPLFALLNFAKFPFADDAQAPAEISSEDTDTDATQVAQAASKDNDSDKGTLAFRVNIVQSSVKLLADPLRSDSEAIVLSIRQIQMAQQGTFVLSVDHLGIFLCKMDKQDETIRILDDFDLNLSMDNRSEDGSQNTSIELDIQPLVLRLSNRDIVLVSGIVTRAVELSGSGDKPSKQGSDTQQDSQPSNKRPAQTQNLRNSTSAASVARRRSSSAKRPKAEVLLTKETVCDLTNVMLEFALTSSLQLRAVFGGLRLVLISDLHELPVLDMKTPRFTARVEDWSADMRAGLTLTPVLNYYNLTNSRWEALMDPWEFSVQATRNAATQATAVTLASKKRFEINVTHTFIELAMNTMTLWSQKGDEVLKTSRGSNAPFLMCNRTGHSMVIWAESEDKTVKPEPVRIADGEDLPWRLDDWRAMRESATSNLVHNSIGLILEETQWERVKHISVEREGEQTYRLKPRLDKVAHRVLCEIKLVNNVKVVTIRSTLKVQNLTLVPSEMVIVDANGKKASAVFKLAPGAEVSVPIEAAYHQRFKFRPDPGFDHAWCNDSYHWQDFIKRPARTIVCRSLEKDASFRFQAFAEFDKDDPLIKTYPRMTLRLRAPVEIENLLPYDIRFRVYDKNREHNWSSFLRKGGTSPLHMAELSHLLLLSVEIQDSPFKRSEFAIVNTDNPDDLPIEHHTPVEDRNGLKMNLQLFYIRYPSAGGAFKVQIYSPYVLFNKTGLDFALKSKSPLSSPKNVAGLDVFSPGSHRSGTSPYLFNHGSRDARNRVLLRIADSSWSEPLSFETIGTDVEIVIPSQSGTEEIHVGMSVTEGLGDYKIIKVITLYPRFVLKNTLSKAIRLRPGGATYTLTLEPQERQALHWLKRGSETLISLAYSPFGEWTSLFKLNEVGETHLRLQNEEGVEDLIRADVAVSAAIVYVTVCTEERGYPIILENASDFEFTVAQLISPPPRARLQDKKYTLKAHDKLPYAWDDPMQEKKSIILSVAGQTREVRPTEIGAQVPYKFGSGPTQGTVSIDVLAEGHTQVVRITNYDEQLSLFKLQRRETSLSMTRTSSQSSAREAEFEAKEEKSPILFTFNLSLEGIGLSLVNKQMVELLYATLRGIRLTYNDSADSQQVVFSIKWIQIDNQLFGTQYNLLLYPSTIPKDAKELEARPNLNVAISLLKDKGHGVLYFKYANILLQQMTIEVDEDFLFSLLDFSKFRGVAGADSELDNRLTEEGEDLPEAPQTQASTEVFFETLWLQPIQLDLSFMRTETVNSESALFSGNRNAVAYFLNAVTMAIGNVNDAPIRLSALIFEDIRLSHTVLAQRIILHYQQEFINQLYRVIGSADFLGNPIGLFSNVSSGVADLFYEPTEGVVEFRDFGSGLARGAGSFVKKTLFGVTDSMTKFTGSIGKGLSAATLDKQFQSQRRQRQRRNKPRHALYGVAAGAGSFVTSVASGFEGLARLPIEGAESGGAGGFFKGFGKGLVGVATKPVVGMFDFASNVTEGIRNTTTVFDQKAIDAVRLPRLIPHDRVLRPYNEREALGQFWLKNLENGRYREEHYVSHLPISGEKEEDLMVIVTNSAIILARVTKSKVMWHVPLRDLQSITLEPNGISLVLREGARGPFLALPDQESRLWLFGHIERVVNSHNTQRRVE